MKQISTIVTLLFVLITTASSAKEVPGKLQNNIFSSAIALQAYTIDSKTVLQWATRLNAEQNYFELQKSTDAVNYSTIALIFSTESDDVEHYFFKESKSLQTGSFYRLKIINKNNTIAFSNSLLLKANVANKNLDILENPVHDNLSFNYRSISNDYATINIYDLLGNIVFNIRAKCAKGQNYAAIWVAEFLPGEYVLEVITGNKKNSEHFIKL
jgi:hypothetical protein